MIEKEQLQHIAKLARLGLKEEEIPGYQQDISQILDYFTLLQEADTRGASPMTHVAHKENVSREDLVKKESPERVSAMLKLAPLVKDGFLKVKAILSFK